MPSFVNPYTFIPLRSRSNVQLAGTSKDEPEYTGVISCTLLTKTPVAIPADGVRAGEGAPEVAKCLRVGGRLIIPGSSLRGPVRSVYEALTGSCMRVNGGPEHLLHSAGGRKRPGLLEWSQEQGGFVLWSARRYRVTDLDLCEGWVTGDAAHIAWGAEPRANGFATSDGVVTEMGPEEFDGSAKGWFLRVNQMEGATANSPSVFVRDALIGKVDGRYVECLDRNASEYLANNPDSAYASDYRDRATLLAREHVGTLPVWYSHELLDDNTWSYAFSHAQLSRSYYPLSPDKFVSDKGLAPCTSESQEGGLCPACRLFGFVDDSGETGEARASRVRFTDAVPKGDVHSIVHTIEVHLPALLGPRTSAFEFYLRNDTLGRGQVYTPETPGTTISGRKMYWHSPTGALPVEQESDFDTTVECIASGSKFAFDVFFDGITRAQLNELVYALTLGDEWVEGGGDHCHKIGHGKPAGLGSVKVTVDRVLVRTCDASAYSLVPWNDCPYDEEGGLVVRMGANAVRRRFDPATREAVLNVTDFGALGNSYISYPRTRQGGDIFDWFAADRKRSFMWHGRLDDDATLPGYAETLPDAVSNEQGLDREPNADGVAYPPGQLVHP